MSCFARVLGFVEAFILLYEGVVVRASSSGFATAAAPLLL